MYAPSKEEADRDRQKQGVAHALTRIYTRNRVVLRTVENKREIWERRKWRRKSQEYGGEMTLAPGSEHTSTLKEQWWLSEGQEPTEWENRNQVLASDSTICKQSNKAPIFAHCCLATRCQDQRFLDVAHLILTECTGWSCWLQRWPPSSCVSQMRPSLCHGLPTTHHSHCNPSMFSGPRSSLCSSLPGWLFPWLSPPATSFYTAFGSEGLSPGTVPWGLSFKEQISVALRVIASLSNQFSSLVCSLLSDRSHSLIPSLSRKYSTQRRRPWHLDAQSS